jgi:multiple sugar transport system permease protein
MLDPGVGILNYMLQGLGFGPLNIFGDPNLAMLGTILADSWVRIPFMYVLILAGIESIPLELYDSARVDGASSIQTFRYITLPLAKASMLVGIFITSMFVFRTIDVIWSMTRGGPAGATYVLGINKIEFLTSYLNLGLASAVGVLIFAIIAVFIGLPLTYLLFGRKEKR